MENKWKSSQSLIISIIVILIFTYISIDALVTKPKIKHDLNNVKGQYVELSVFLDQKVPQIDSTFREHAIQIQQQKGQISVLQETLGEIEDK